MSSAVAAGGDPLCVCRSTGLEKVHINETRWRQQFDGKPYLDMYDAEYPVGELRQAALDLVRPAEPHHVRRMQCVLCVLR